MIIPFFIPHAGCPHRCVFCDQKRITGRHAAPEPSSVSPTISRYLATRTDAGPAEVAFYGGSFTALAEELQRSYLEAVGPFIAAGTVGGIRLSTRPDAITPDILTRLKHHHVTTVELGVQSLDDEVLRLSGRGHTAADTVKAVGLLKAHGFSTGIQLMPGLPGDSPGCFGETVRQAIELRPDLVRIYPALVIEGTPLADLYRTGRFTPLALDDAVDLCRDAMDRFEGAGIAVVRVGLQPTEELERRGTILAGPWHPAFGQLVASSRLLGSMSALIGKDTTQGPVRFAVHPADLSSAIGQDRRNIHALKERFGRDATIVADPSVPKGAVTTGSACTGAKDGL